MVRFFSRSCFSPSQSCSHIFFNSSITADVLIVGRFLGQESLAAVGATTAIFDLIVGFTLGVGNGMGIVIARFYVARGITKIMEEQ